MVHLQILSPRKFSTLQYKIQRKIEWVEKNEWMAHCSKLITANTIVVPVGGERWNPMVMVQE